MNASHLDRKPTSGFHLGLGVFAATILIGAFPAFAQDPPMLPGAAVKPPGNHVFKPVEIKPSPDGKSYEGRFLFINKSPLPVTYHGSHQPVDGKFETNLVGFQILKEGKWESTDRFVCGTGTRDFELTPDKEYILVSGLDEFKEQGTPITCRIGLEEFWSESFVLDWKKDRSAGKFEQARTENSANVRAGLVKAGFKEELLTGDGFCTAILQSLFKETAAKDMAASFRPFVGKLDVVPRIDLQGAIHIEAGSDEERAQQTEYNLYLQIDPSHFTHDWFRNAPKWHLEINEWGDGFQMRLIDYNDPPFRLEIIYEPFKGSKHPSKEDASRFFGRVLSAFDRWLK